jgi:hypothetical protein
MVERPHPSHHERLVVPIPGIASLTYMGHETFPLKGKLLVTQGSMVRLVFGVAQDNNPWVQLGSLPTIYDSAKVYDESKKPGEKQLPLPRLLFDPDNYLYGRQVGNDRISQQIDTVKTTSIEELEEEMMRTIGDSSGIAKLAPGPYYTILSNDGSATFKRSPVRFTGLWTPLETFSPSEWGTDFS